jgi:ABC-type Mn2+/Zn2+ transport system permease subunit
MQRICKAPAPVTAAHGSLLVGALVIIPPATARMISRDMQRYASSSLAIGIISSVGGVPQLSNAKLAQDPLRELLQVLA